MPTGSGSTFLNGVDGPLVENVPAVVHRLRKSSNIGTDQSFPGRDIMTNSDNQLPVTSNPVPVFDCHVIVTPADGNGVVRVRSATLPDVTASGPTERDALLTIVKEFKEFVRPFSERSEAVPFAEQPEAPDPGESERWIPVHL